MSTPIVESIAAKLADYIDAITTANGFNQDLVAVRPKRIHLEGNANDNNKVYIEQESADVVARTLETLTWKQQFALQAIVIDSDNETDAIDTRLNKIRSDIEKQLCATANRFLGGLAEGIEFRSTERFISFPETAVIVVNVDVTYSTDYDDPYTLT